MCVGNSSYLNSKPLIGCNGVSTPTCTSNYLSCAQSLVTAKASLGTCESIVNAPEADHSYTKEIVVRDSHCGATGESASDDGPGTSNCKMKSAFPPPCRSPFDLASSKQEPTRVIT